MTLASLKSSPSNSAPLFTNALSTSQVTLLSLKAMVLRLPILSTRPLYRQVRKMGSKSSELTYFGPYEITTQVFYNTPHSYCLVNIKPLLPGHVLVISNRMVPRLTDLTATEVTDLFTTVQKVQKMLARVYFTDKEENGGTGGKVEDGAFNVGMQDGVWAGQTVPHVHVHIIPRPKTSPQSDEIHERMESEEGNVGGALWDRSRPVNQGQFDKPEESARKNRPEEEMIKEATFFREQMALLD